MAKRAQGLPLNLIVLAAIAALILVLIIAFTVGGAGSFFGKIFQTSTTAVGDQMETVKTTCNSLCSQAESSTTSNAFTSSSYCSRKFNIDQDGSGKLGGYASDKGGDCTKPGLTGNYNCKGQKEKSITCFDAGVACTASISTPSGGLLTCTYNSVSNACECA